MTGGGQHHVTEWRVKEEGTLSKGAQKIDTESRRIISRYSRDSTSGWHSGLSVRVSDATKYNVQPASRWSSASFPKTLVGVPEPMVVVPSVDEVVGTGTCVSCRVCSSSGSLSLPLGFLEPVLAAACLRLRPAVIVVGPHRGRALPVRVNNRRSKGTDRRGERENEPREDGHHEGGTWVTARISRRRQRWRSFGTCCTGTRAKSRAPPSGCRGGGRAR